MSLGLFCTVTALSACAGEDTTAQAPPVPVTASSADDLNAVALPEGMTFGGLRARGHRLSPAQVQAAGRDAAALDNLEVLARSERRADQDAQRHVLNARVVAGRRNAAGIALYQIEYRLRGVWRPLCAGGAEGVLVDGAVDTTTGAYRADPAESSWACAGTAMGQCAAMGYAPGAVANNSTLSTLFASCVRAVRADYCGDGVPRTAFRNGTPIDVYDNLDVVARGAGSAALSLEADWRPDGAYCVHGNSGIANVCAREIPSCGADDPRGVITRVGP
jgi:hypothetical protein